MSFRTPRDPFRWFGVWFVFCLLLGLGFLGFIVWAVISFVTHVTG